MYNCKSICTQVCSSFISLFKLVTVPFFFGSLSNSTQFVFSIFLLLFLFLSELNIYRGQSNGPHMSIQERFCVTVKDKQAQEGVFQKESQPALVEGCINHEAQYFPACCSALLAAGPQQRTAQGMAWSLGCVYFTVILKLSII